MKTLIINFFAGPGCGKSTMAGGIFNDLKTLDYNVEYVQEFAKTLTWEKNFLALSNQAYVSGVQQYTQNMLLGQVQAIITDSPLILGLMYYKEPNIRIKEAFETFLIESFKAQHNINFLLKRVKKYNTSGRNQTLEEACEIDEKIEKFLTNNNIPYTITTGNDTGRKEVLSKIKEII